MIDKKRRKKFIQTFHKKKYFYLLLLLLISLLLAIISQLKLIINTSNSSNIYNKKLFGVNIAGAEFNGQPIYPTDTYTGYTYFHNKGLSLIRLPFLWERLQASFNGPLTADADRYGRMITDAANAGDQVIIDPHNYARYDGVPLTADDASKLADLWTKLATKFQSYPGIWGYELMNEPHDLAGGCQTWKTIAQSSVTAIRVVDTTHYILIPGYQFQSAHDWQTQSDCLSNIADPANKIIYAAHQYFDSDLSGLTYNTTPCPDIQRAVTVSRPFLDWLEQNHEKGIFTEFGVPPEACWLKTLNNFMQALEANPNIVGGTYWAAGPGWGNYILSIEPENGQDKPQMSVLENYPSR